MPCSFLLIFAVFATAYPILLIMYIYSSICFLTDLVVDYDVFDGFDFSLYLVSDFPLFFLCFGSLFSIFWFCDDVCWGSGFLSSFLTSLTYLEAYFALYASSLICLLLLLYFKGGWGGGGVGIILDETACPCLGTFDWFLEGIFWTLETSNTSSI